VATAASRNAATRHRLWCGAPSARGRDRGRVPRPNRAVADFSPRSLPAPEGQPYRAERRGDRGGHERGHRDQLPRRAGVSSFGVGGTNAHVIMEEAPLTALSGSSRSKQLILLSAKTENALQQRLQGTQQSKSTEESSRKLLNGYIDNMEKYSLMGIEKGDADAIKKFNEVESIQEKN
jgi:hypothetical protein